MDVSSFSPYSSCVIDIFCPLLYKSSCSLLFHFFYFTHNPSPNSGLVAPECIPKPEHALCVVLTLWLYFMYLLVIYCCTSCNVTVQQEHYKDIEQIGGYDRNTEISRAKFTIWTRGVWDGIVMQKCLVCWGFFVCQELWGVNGQQWQSH